MVVSNKAVRDALFEISNIPDLLTSVSESVITGITNYTSILIVMLL